MLTLDTVNVCVYFFWNPDGFISFIFSFTDTVYKPGCPFLIQPSLLFIVIKSSPNVPSCFCISVSLKHYE